MNLKFHFFDNNSFTGKFEQKRVGRSPQEIRTRPTYTNILIRPKTTI